MRIIKIRDSYYCIINQKYTINFVKEEYMNKAKVKKDSFAEKYTESIFNNIFNNSTDLKAEYIDFYKEEYCNFKTFLYQKELFSEGEIMDLNISKDETLLKIVNEFGLNDNIKLNMVESLFNIDISYLQSLYTIFKNRLHKILLTNINTINLKHNLKISTKGE